MLKPRNQARMNSAITGEDKELHGVRRNRWLPAVALFLAPGGLLGVDVPHIQKAELEELTSGRVEIDETNGDGDLKTLLGSGGTGRVEIRMTVNSGSYRWTMRQGETEIDGGTLESGNGWVARPDEVGTGVYSLEITRTGEEPGEDAFRRRIDFASGIAAGDVDSVRKSYDAVARHGRRDYLGALNALESVDSRSVPVSEQMREQLAWARIDGMLYFRKFEDLLSAIEAFKTDHPSSDRLASVRECEMAALFERGLKKSIEAARFQDAASDDRRAEGRSNLMRFMALAAEHSSIDYAVLPSRDLRKDQWTARLILGEEEAASEEIGDPVLREEFRLHCALMCPDVFAGRPDENIARMQGFLKDYPGSRYRPRIELELGIVAVIEGERLVKVSAASQATPYLDLARAQLNDVVVNEEAGIVLADVGEAWEGMLRACYWQGDDANLISWTERIISMTQTGGTRWRQAKLYQAASLARNYRYEKAAVLLDELVAFGFKGNPSHDGRTAAAVEWRIHVARSIGDEGTMTRLLQWVADSECEDSVKRELEQKFQWLVSE